MIKLAGSATIQTKARFSEWLARFLTALILIGLPLVAFLYAHKDTAPNGDSVELHARTPENGGWSQASLLSKVGQPLHLRLVSDDVMHSFKIGQSDEPAIDLLPGKTVETTLTFQQPGKYTFYCTRWCGPNHWRMRGTIEVLPLPEEPAQTAAPQSPPLYVGLGLDIDSPHPAQVTPQKTPAAAQGVALDIDLPAVYLTQSFYRTHSPAQAWEILRRDSLTYRLDDQQVWDLVALVWFKNIGSSALEKARDLYAENCAACHGESGAGDGIFAAELPAGVTSLDSGMGINRLTQKGAVDFTNPPHMLGASPALLQGKILRGGMGTSMPYWGPIFTEDEIWDLVGKLYTFQFNLEVDQ
jgi:mono/diheme cytochrome c family protein